MPKLTRKKLFTFIKLFIVFIVFPLSVYLFQRPPQFQAKAQGETNYYVDSISGSDTNLGTSENQAWQTLNPVHTKNFQPGNVIHFKRGSTWTGGLVIDDSGREDSPITFKAYGGGEKPVFRNPGSWTRAITINADWVILEGLLVRDAHEAGVRISDDANYNIVRGVEATDVGIGIAVHGQHNLITQNHTHDLSIVVNNPGGNNDYGAVGIWLFNSNNEVSYNKMVNCKASSYDYEYDGGAVEWYGSADNSYIHHNWATGSKGFLEVGGGSAKDTTVAYNVTVNNGRFSYIHLSGVFASDVNNFRVENNTIVDTEDYDKMEWAMFGFAGTPNPNTFQIRNNIFYVNDYQYISYPASSNFTHQYNFYYLLNPRTQIGFSLGPGEQIANPQFTNIQEEDFHLQSESPAIDAGVDLGYTLDFDGQPVPRGPAPDLGAYEYTGGFTPTPTSSPSPNPYDLDDNSQVNGADVLILLGNWRNGSRGDFNSDGKVNGIDFGMLITHWSM